MTATTPGALVEVPAELVEAMPVNGKDRHVLALAVHVGAPTIVTRNLRDVPPDLPCSRMRAARSPGLSR